MAFTEEITGAASWLMESKKTGEAAASSGRRDETLRTALIMAMASQLAGRRTDLFDGVKREKDD